MKRICLLLSVLLMTVTAFAQNDGLMNYNGHWYALGDNSLDKEALRYQQLLKEKSSFDSLAKRKDVFVNRQQFSATLTDLDKLVADEMMNPNSGQVNTLLQDYVSMVKTIKTFIQGNEEYRRYVNNASARVLMARREGWSNDLYWYILRESTFGTLRYLNMKANTDNTLSAVMTELNKNEKYKTCQYNILVDTRMMDDPDMQMFICDRMEYILGADIYRYRESTPGVVSNYSKRKKESGELMGWLLKRANEDKVNFIVLADYLHNTGNKPNEAIAKLHNNADWYVFLFYKGFLYYSDALPRCNERNDISILYKP